MAEFYEKRPVFHAAQFLGRIDSIKDVFDVEGYTITGGGGEVTSVKVKAVQADGKTCDVTINERDWLVSTPDGFKIVSDRNFRSQYEAVK